MMGDIAMSPEAIRRMVGSSIHIIVHLVRFRDGSRRVTSIREIVQEANELKTREIFSFQTEGLDAKGRMTGSHQYAGGEINILERVRQQGFDTADLQESLATASGGQA